MNVDSTADVVVQWSMNVDYVVMLQRCQHSSRKSSRRWCCRSYSSRTSSLRSASTRVVMMQTICTAGASRPTTSSSSSRYLRLALLSCTWISHHSTCSVHLLLYLWLFRIIGDNPVAWRLGIDIIDWLCVIALIRWLTGSCRGRSRSRWHDVRGRTVHSFRSGCYYR